MNYPVILAEEDKNELLKLIIRKLKNALTQNHFLNTHLRFTRNTGLSLGCTGIQEGYNFMLDFRKNKIGEMRIISHGFK